MHLHPHQPGLILPSSLNVRQKAAVATLCTLCSCVHISLTLPCSADIDLDVLTDLKELADHFDLMAPNQMIGIVSVMGRTWLNINMIIFGTFCFLYMPLSFAEVDHTIKGLIFDFTALACL